MSIGNTEIFLIVVCLILLLCCAWTDGREQVIPNRYLKWGIGIRTLVLSVEIALDGKDAVGAFVIRSGLAILIVVLGVLIKKMTRDGIGMGDLKLTALMYLYLNSEIWAEALLFALLSGGGYAFVCKIQRRGKHRFAFAPFLWMGTVLAVIRFFH